MGNKLTVQLKGHSAPIVFRNATVQNKNRRLEVYDTNKPNEMVAVASFDMDGVEHWYTEIDEAPLTLRVVEGPSQAGTAIRTSNT
jgi:hypothetical protein